ncbi:MAG: hypothetical protein ACYSSP_14500 [Planctomycetota bacterium]|jgi:hypothetical protein
MGLWSSVKSIAKKTWRGIKGAARQLGRVIAEVAGRIIGLPDLLLGFITWPSKKLRIKILILSDQNGKAVSLASDLTMSIDYAKKVFKDRLNVKLLPYPGPKKPMVELIADPAPAAALNVGCGSNAWGEEFGEAGEFFADHLPGLVFPITVFVVKDVIGKEGCSLGPLTDYATLDPSGIKSGSTLAHEVAHACSLWHSGSKSNLMWKNPNRGDSIKWWQKNLFRSSRHVTYW